MTELTGIDLLELVQEAIKKAVKSFSEPFFENWASEWLLQVNTRPALSRKIAEMVWEHEHRPYSRLQCGAAAQAAMAAASYSEGGLPPVVERFAQVSIEYSNILLEG